MTDLGGHVGRIGTTLADSRPAFDDTPRPPSGAPNVVMIVLDDLGFADLGCYGSSLATPRIDSLAEQGLRYNSFHVTPICFATRGCLLTGRNHHSIGLGGPPMGFAGYNGRIPKSAGTLPRLLRDAGYNTMAVGKWHLTPRYEDTPAGPFDHWPLGMGFDRYYGFLKSETDQWTPDLVCDNGFVEPPLTPGEGYHLTEDLATQAIRFVQDQQQAAPGKPFFLYFATGAVHSPHHVPDRWVEPYRGQFNDGWEAHRERVFERQRELGIVPRRTKLTERPPWVRPWNELSSDERKLFSRMMEIYAGFLTHTDAQVGRLIDLLTALDVLDNTLIMVMSDNGAAAQGGPNGFVDRFAPRRECEPSSMIRRLPEIGGFRTYNTYSWGWAWSGNTPFRLWKGYTWLGGVRVPLIVHWPAGIDPNSAGEIRSQFCHAVDLMPTILKASDVEVPDALDGVSQKPLDGASILATLAEPDTPSPRDRQYFEMIGSRAIYHDGWMATTNHVQKVPDWRRLIEGSYDFDTDSWSLFDLRDDFSQAKDVATEHPKRLQRMIELWWSEAGRNQVLPLIDQDDYGAAVEPRNPTRSHHVYLPHGGAIFTPSLSAGFVLNIELEVANSHELSGVICAQGDWHLGWACYALHEQVIIAMTDGGNAERMVIPDAIPLGKHELELSYSPQTIGDGSSVRVTVDRQEVATGTVSAELALPFVVGTGGRLLIGRDRGFPVCEDYVPPFPFTGNIRRVTLEVPTRGAE